MRYQSIVKEWQKIVEGFFQAEGELFEKVVTRVAERMRAGQKILIFGNGGSAAQAQHFSAELVNKFLKERPPFRAISLTTDTSILTSVPNDTSFDFVFSRQIEALGNRGDVAIGLSTSGSSPNVVRAIKVANNKELLTVAFTGEGGGKLASLPDFLFCVPSESTPRIQEVHLLLLHILAQELEERMG